MLFRSRPEDRVGLSSGVAGLDGLFDDALWADHISDPPGVAVAGVLTGLVGETDGAIGVAEEWVGVVELLHEGGVLLEAVEGGTEDDSVLLFQFGGSITEPASLLRSPGRVGLGEEPEDQALAAEV